MRIDISNRRQLTFTFVIEQAKASRNGLVQICWERARHGFSQLRQIDVCSWPNPAVWSSIAGCQVKNPAAAATGQYRPEVDDALD
jgi:hypothetical protein